MVAANLPVPGHAANFWAVLATYQANFPHVRVFATQSRSNFIPMASSAAPSIDPTAMQRQISRLRSGHRTHVDLAALAALPPP